MTTLRRWVCVALVPIALGLTSGCGPGYQDMPLPGSGVSGATYEITAEFNNVLNLAQGAQIKVNGVNAGRVRSIRVQDYRAVVTMELKDDVQLPVGTTARLRYDTPLGELFVQVDPAPTKGKGLLEDGDSMSAADTSTAPTVEDALASASLLINGGGLDQTATITEELNKALSGREDTFRSALDNTNQFLREINGSTDEIDAVLRGLSRVGQVLGAREDTIDRALREVGPAAKVLRENTDELVELLARLDGFSRRSVRLLEVTREDNLQILRQLAPILDEVLATKPQFSQTLRSMVDAAALLSQAVPGDFFPIDALLRINVAAILAGGPDDGSDEGPDDPDVPELPDLPDTPEVPELPDLPGLPDSTTDSDGLLELWKLQPQGAE